MNKPFRIRARRLIIKIVNTRTYLIRKNKDKKEIPIVALEIIKEKIEPLRSDQQFKKFIQNNFFDIKKLIPKNNAYNNYYQQLEDLYYENI